MREFERRWADWLGARHAVFVNSGSSANLLMYYAPCSPGGCEPEGRRAGDRLGDDRRAGDPARLRADHVRRRPDHLRPRPRPPRAACCDEHDPAAVIIVHDARRPGRHGRGCCGCASGTASLFMEDCLPGARLALPRPAWSARSATSARFSFYFGHHLSTIEGGMVATDDDRLYELLLHLRCTAGPRTSTRPREAELAAERDVARVQPGLHLLPPRLQLPLDRPERLPRPAPDGEGRLGRRAAGREPPPATSGASPAPPTSRSRATPTAVTCSISFVALASSREHRERVGAALRAEGIETRPLGGGSMGRQPFWVDRFGAQPLPVADRLHETSFMPPNHPYLSQPGHRPDLRRRAGGRRREDPRHRRSRLHRLDPGPGPAGRRATR